MAEVLIIGAGVSGLAAAVRLAGAGHRVRVLERGPRAGGRCYSYRDETSGDVVDNGQHVLVGAYHHTLTYLRTIGTDQCLRAYREIPFHLRGRGIASLRLGSWPAPFHLLGALLGYDHLSLGERLALLRVGAALRTWDGRTSTFPHQRDARAWLRSLGQGDAALERLWVPLCVSVMNERPERASALLLARALRTTFLGSADDASLLVPTVGQTELYVDPAATYLRRRGGELLLGTEAVRVECDARRITGVRLADGTFLGAEFVVCAVPPAALGRILPPEIAAGGALRKLSEFAMSPIVSVHCWFDRAVLPLPFVGVLGGGVQWLFNRRRILGDPSGPASVSAVVSAAYAEVERTKEELVAMTLEDLRAVAPGAGQARLLSSVVIKEKRATFSATAEAEGLRPPARTEVSGLLLAGDWTGTGLPATIEGAIRSGFEAAAAVAS